MKPLTTTPKEVLHDAILAEDETRGFYLALSERAATPEVKARLSELADRELVHRAKLERKFRERFHEDPPAPKKVDVEVPDDLVDIDMARALKIALEHERESESDYRFLAERVPNTELGALFMELAEIEWKHKVEVQAMYNSESIDPEQFLLDI